jgi:hypothetical protein
MIGMCARSRRSWTDLCGAKLEQAVLFRAQIVAMTRDEKTSVLAALERAPAELAEVRELLFADENWREGRRSF